MNNNIEIQREQDIEIVGTQYDGRAINHKNLMFHQKLIMKHQSNNIHDSNAVIILTDDGKELGYMPKGYASIYAPVIDSGRYSFAVEIIKTKYDFERPILIVKVTSELNNCSEEEIERNILQFVQNIVNIYAQKRTEYLDFIYSETINIDELIASLNGVRLIQKLYSLSGDIINNHNIEQTTSDYSPYTKEVLLKIIGELQADINDVLKKIQKAYNESLDIDDEEEYYKVQSETRERRKKFRSYNELFTRYYESVEKYVVVNTDAVSDVEIKNEITSENSEYITENVYYSEQNQTLIIDKTSNLTEKAFLDWLMSDGDVSETTAKNYISNIHSIEKLYQFLYGVRKNLLGAVSADNAKVMIETLISRSEYIDANERRHNIFSITLNKFAQFADIYVDGLKNQSKKKNYQPPDKSGTFVVKTVDFENPNNCTYYKPCSFILNNFKYYVKNWYELYTKFLQLLYNDNTYTEIMKSMIGKSLCGYKSDFEKRSYHLRRSIRVSADFYAEGNLSAIDIIKRIKCLMNLCSIDDNNMIIEYSTHEKIVDISEETIETLTTESSELNEIEDGYYVLSEPKCTTIITGKQASDTTETIIRDVTTQGDVSDTRRIILRINGNIIRTYDYSDALNKICEFAINYKPFRMARIAEQNICIKGINIFYRKAVPVDGYNKLSNGLQIKVIDTLTDLQTITDEIRKYCQIDDDMIIIISK